MHGYPIELYVISHYDNLQMDADEIASTLQVPVAEVQAIIDRHVEELDQWLLRAADYYPTAEVYCEFDR